MKRILLFLATNIAVMVVLAIVTQVLGVDPKTSGGLVIFSAVIGFTGSIFSLLLSKQIAKWSTPGFRTIEQPQTADEAWIVETVRRFAEKAGIGMPEVGIYEGDPNAFATGASRNNALVAVSTGLLRVMSRDEVEAAWRWIDPILKGWEETGQQVQGYTSGTWGPSQSIALIERDGRTWHEA